MAREADIFGSPTDPRRDFSVMPPRTSLDSADLDGIQAVTIIDADGSTTVSKEMAEVDRGRLKPRLGQHSLRDVVTSANERWALGDDPSHGATDA